MATSTNFGWTEPDDTDLVKNGAAAMRTLGNAIDSSLYTLSGGIAGKNAAINGGQDIWQRGTSFTTTAAYVYCSDRWYYSRSAGNTTVSRQTDAPTGFNYSIRLARNSGDTNTSPFTFHQALETSESLRFAGQTVTFSFYAKAGANYSAGAIPTYINTGTGTDQAATGQNAGTWTGFTSPLNGSTFTPTTTWTRYTFTATIGSTATQIGMGFLTNNFSGTAGANDWVQFTGLQLELGSTATPFSRAGGTIQGELAACQRYYIRYNATSTNAYSVFASAGMTASTTQGIAYTDLPVELRTNPSSVEYGGNLVVNATGTTQAVTSIALQDRSSNKKVSITYTVASGLTANQYCYVRADNSSTAYLGISAEL